MPTKNIQLQRYDDGTPSVLRKPTYYQTLHFYRKSEVLVQLTKVFCDRFLPKYGDRTVDQMVQAARSIKQNIAEGCTDGQTSVEVEIKLLGIARGSNQELLEDYQDYLKHNGIPEWAKAGQTGGPGGPGSPSNPGGPGTPGGPGGPGSPGYYIQRFNRLREFAKAHSDVEDYMPYFRRWTDEEMANCAICLCHMVDRAMCSFIAVRDKEFVEQGGIRERMTAARLDMRGTQKQIIERQQHEIEQLRAQVASLQRELTALRGEGGGAPDSR